MLKKTAPYTEIGIMKSLLPISVFVVVLTTLSAPLCLGAAPICRLTKGSVLSATAFRHNSKGWILASSELWQRVLPFMKGQKIKLPSNAPLNLCPGESSGEEKTYGTPNSPFTVIASGACEAAFLNGVGFKAFQMENYGSMDYGSPLPVRELLLCTDGDALVSCASLNEDPQKLQFSFECLNSVFRREEGN